MRGKLLLVVVVVLVLVASCGEDYPQVEASSYEQLEGTRIYRIVDRDAEVVCWVYDGIERAGISCLPLADTAIAGAKE